MFIETKDLPVTELVKVGKYHQLAEWMREGAKRTKQCRLVNFVYCGNEVVETCALAAAALASGCDLWRQFGSWMIREMPEAIRWRIIRKNDCDGWTREQIADWLCREGGCEHVLLT